jgi:hypothetical protein
VTQHRIVGARHRRVMLGIYQYVPSPMPRLLIIAVFGYEWYVLGFVDWGRGIAAVASSLPNTSSPRCLAPTGIF